MEKKEEIIKETGNSLLSSTNLKWIAVWGKERKTCNGKVIGYILIQLIVFLLENYLEVSRIS